MYRLWLLLLLCLSLTGCISGYGEVVAVVDGDTIDVLMDGHELIRVRFAYIDAPERGQAYGNKARQLLADKVFRQDVELIETGMHGDRMVAIVLLDGEDVSYALVEAGLAWVDPRYNEDFGLLRAEAKARAARVGLWSEPDSMPPWEWRRQK